MIKVLLLLLSCFPTLCLAGSDSTKQKPTLIVGSGLQTGFIIPHSSELKEVSESSPWGINVDISKLMYSDKAWNNCNCYSKLGLAFNYYNYSNPAQLGNSYNLILFVEPKLGFRKKVNMSLRTGLGATYLDQVYDPVNNPDNLFYSSPLSFILQLQLKLNYEINKRNIIYLLASYNHISNGAIQKPNKGMNFPTFGLGYEYIIRPVKLEKKAASDQQAKKWMKYARIFWNIRTIAKTNEFPEVYDVMIGLEGGVQRKLSNINGLLTGLEFSYDGLYREEIYRYDIDTSPLLFSLHLGHYFVFGKLLLPSNLPGMLPNLNLCLTKTFFSDMLSYGNLANG